MPPGLKILSSLVGSVHFANLTLKILIFTQGFSSRWNRVNCCCAFSLCRDNNFASTFYSIFLFFSKLFKTYNLGKSMRFFSKRKSYFRIGLVAKNWLFACHRCNAFFLKFCSSCKDPHTICIAAVLFNPSFDRSPRTNSIKYTRKMYISDISV